ncbi:MAG: type IX secretion system protein PorQ [Saprospiraceae bacterium]|nr:type IX secretion system protein PorQ [Saprospiraceae bacterium]
MNYIRIIFCCLIFIDISYGQIETDRVFPILNHVTSARMAAHGGYAIASIDQDINVVYSNPAFYNPENHFDLSFNHQFQFLQTGIGNLTLGKKIKWNDLSLHAGIQYANFGNIPGYDENGQPTTTLNANEYNFLAGTSFLLYENMRVGANLKFLHSNLAEYTSNAMAFDIGFAYHIPESPSTIGFAIRNIGSQLTNYGNYREPMPLDVQASGSIRLKHLPLRLGVVAHHLQRWNLLYENPYDVEQSFAIDNQFAQQESKQYGLVDNFFRHLVFQAELAIGKSESFKLRLGYNHLMKRDLSVNGFRSLAGFSGGLGLRVYRFYFDYGLSVYHIAGLTHTLTLATDLSTFKRKQL